jgi:hypothetical protein
MGELMAEARRLWSGFNVAVLGQASPTEKIHLVAKFAAKVFELFLRIHPYANGNGHIARALVLSIFGCFDIWPKKWPLHGRPPGPYGAALKASRRGQPELLVKYIVSCIA